MQDGSAAVGYTTYIVGFAVLRLVFFDITRNMTTYVRNISYKSLELIFSWFFSDFFFITDGYIGSFFFFFLAISQGTIFCDSLSNSFPVGKIPLVKGSLV